MYYRIDKIISKAIKDELRRFDCRKSYDIWDVYFCSLAHLRAELGNIDLYTLCSNLLIAIADKKRLISENDKYKISRLIDMNREAMQKSNLDFINYKSNWDSITNNSLV